MSLKSQLLTPFQIPGAHEILDCTLTLRDGKYDVSIHMSPEKVKAVFKRFMDFVERHSLAELPEVDSYTKALLNTCYAYPLILEDHPQYNPVNHVKIKEGIAYWVFQMRKVVLAEGVNDPAFASTVTAVKAVKARHESIEDNSEEDYKRIVYFSVEDLKPAPISNDKAQLVYPLPSTVVRHVVDYFYLPLPLNKMVDMQRHVKHSAFSTSGHIQVGISFQYSGLLTHLDSLLRCDLVTACFSSVSSYFSTAAQTTYHYSEVAYKLEHTNARWQDELGRCHWQLNPSLEVDRLMQAGCTEPAVRRISDLFKQYGIKPGETVICEEQREEMVKYPLNSSPDLSRLTRSLSQQHQRDPSGSPKIEPLDLKLITSPPGSPKRLMRSHSSHQRRSPSSSPRKPPLPAVEEHGFALSPRSHTRSLSHQQLGRTS